MNAVSECERSRLTHVGTQRTAAAVVDARRGSRKS